MINYNSPECLDEIFWINSKKGYYNQSLNTENKIDLKILTKIFLMKDLMK